MLIGILLPEGRKWWRTLEDDDAGTAKKLLLDLVGNRRHPLRRRLQFGYPLLRSLQRRNPLVPLRLPRRNLHPLNPPALWSPRLGHPPMHPSEKESSPPEKEKDGQHSILGDMWKGVRGWLFKK